MIIMPIVVDIPPDRKLTIDVPQDVPVGRVVVMFEPEEGNTYGPPHGKPVLGCAKGQIWMADDFDAPLVEEFKDYM